MVTLRPLGFWKVLLIKCTMTFQRKLGLLLWSVWLVDGLRSFTWHLASTNVAFLLGSSNTRTQEGVEKRVHCSLVIVVARAGGEDSHVRAP